MTPRKLGLRQETLADLTTDELHSVAGASGAPCNLTTTIQSVRCHTTYTLVPTGCMCTGYYPSLNAPCTEILQTTGC